MSGYSVIMDLPHLGELSSRIVQDFARLKGIEVDAESDSFAIAKIVWDNLHEMLDRADFARSVTDDLGRL